MGGPARPRILFLALEGANWKAARCTAYSAQLALEEGLTANGVKHVTLTTHWLDQAREAIGSRKFDQVWLHVVHTSFEESFLEWLVSLAPVRIAFVTESLQHTPEDYQPSPPFEGRLSEAEGILEYLTHVVAGDEKDVEDINDSGSLQAVWWPQAVPRSYVCDGPVPPPRKRSGYFSGQVYGKRKLWVEDPRLKGILEIGGPAERGTVYPHLFDLVHLAMRRCLGERMRPSSLRLLVRTFYRSICGTPTASRHAFACLRFLSAARSTYDVRRALPAYMRLLRLVRQQCFRLWLRRLGDYSAIINLPSYVKAYAGRVVEGMAAGRPVVSWEIPDRPRNKALFEDGKEILLYSDPSQFASHIQRVVAEPELGRRIADDARRKVLRFHTMEERVRQILDWVETGRVPVYS